MGQLIRGLYRSPSLERRTWNPLAEVESRYRPNNERIIEIVGSSPPFHKSIAPHGYVSLLSPLSETRPQPSHGHCGRGRGDWPQKRRLDSALHNTSLKVFDCVADVFVVRNERSHARDMRLGEDVRPCLPCAYMYLCLCVSLPTACFFVHWCTISMRVGIA